MPWLRLLVGAMTVIFVFLLAVLYLMDRKAREVIQQLHEKPGPR